MISTNHLNNPIDVETFADEMIWQLQKHTKDKVSLKDWDPIKVYELCMSELTKRLEICKTHGPRCIEDNDGVYPDYELRGLKQ